MRSDMFKVVVENPRRGSRDKARRWRRTQRNRFDPEDAPARERMRPNPKDFGTKHLGGWGTKDLSETLNPLERYLNKQVGRPWDKVYSDISKCLDPSNAVKQHVRDHLTDFVELNPTINGAGEICPNCRYHSRGYPPTRLGEGKLYVCPNTGILKRARKGKPKRREYWPPESYKCYDGRLVVRATDGVWYWVTLERIPAGIPGSTLYLSYKERCAVPKEDRSKIIDVISGRRASDYYFITCDYGLPGRYAKARFPLSKKDLTNYSLVNRE